MMKNKPNDFSRLLELTPTIMRTAKNDALSFTMVDNRTLHADPRLIGLKRGDKEIHIALLSLPDNWDFKHIAVWLAKKFGFSSRTAYRIIDRLIGAGVLARTWDEDSRRDGYKVFEVPCENRPTGADARKRHVVTTRKASHGGDQPSA